MAETSIRELLTRATGHHRAGELEAARALYQAILAQWPDNADALHLFGLTCHQQGDHETAVEYIRKAVKRVPDQPVLRNNLGDALHKLGDLPAAVLELRRALELRPDYAGAHLNLGSVLAGSGEHEAALLHSREATRLDPQRPEAWFNLGMLLMDQVMLQEAARSFRAALALRPQYPAAANSLLYVLNLLPGADALEAAEEHRRVASAMFNAVARSSEWPIPDGKIRIGYVSGDFRAHAVAFFFEPLLANQDRDRFETYCYSDVTKPDATTGRLRETAQHWREVSGLSDSAVHERIRQDRIDILVDLAGYTEHGRLGVFAGKPARCQISFIGYPNTTGMDAMDFRIVDGYTAPESEGERGTEKLLRIAGGFACFRPPPHAFNMPVGRAVHDGTVTFGSLHKLEKLNAQVIETWARILLSIDGSRLLIARDQLDAWHQQRLVREFQSHGISADRLELLHRCDPAQSFFEIFSRMDVLLDVFPWSGHTIACCALWMGVPVVSLRGETHAGRMVASVLEGMQLHELIASDREEYIRIAVEWGRDQQRLSTLRDGLRQRMEKSPLREEVGYARAWEKACLLALDNMLVRQ
ncbi:MAG: tetratricopeptide repeat protein [Gammaproteobacteria bacterium]|nr:MAG: tetratricopeptide repeat protein [Gammaproteobacteria bacterium]